MVDDDEDDEDEDEDEDEERGEAMSPFQQGTRLRRLLKVVEHTGQAFQEMKWKHMLGAWAPLGRVLDARSGQVLEGGNNLVALCAVEAIRRDARVREIRAKSLKETSRYPFLSWEPRAP